MTEITERSKITSAKITESLVALAVHWWWLGNTFLSFAYKCYINNWKQCIWSCVIECTFKGGHGCVAPICLPWHPNLAPLSILPHLDVKIKMLFRRLPLDSQSIAMGALLPSPPSQWLVQLGSVGSFLLSLSLTLSLCPCLGPQHWWALAHLTSVSAPSPPGFNSLLGLHLEASVPPPTATPVYWVLLTNEQRKRKKHQIHTRSTYAVLGLWGMPTFPATPWPNMNCLRLLTLFHPPGPLLGWHKQFSVLVQSLI